MLLCMTCLALFILLLLWHPLGYAILLGHHGKGQLRLYVETFAVGEGDGMVAVRLLGVRIQEMGLRWLRMVKDWLAFNEVYIDRFASFVSKLHLLNRLSMVILISVLAWNRDLALPHPLNHRCRSECLALLLPFLL